MGFIIVNKNTGELIGDRIFQTEGRANRVAFEVFGNRSFDWAVIPMPSAEILKKVHDGHNYATSVFLGYLTHQPRWDDDEEAEEKE